MDNLLAVLWEIILTVVWKQTDSKITRVPLPSFDKDMVPIVKSMYQRYIPKLPLLKHMGKEYFNTLDTLVTAAIQDSKGRLFIATNIDFLVIFQV